MRRSRSAALSARLALASLGTALAVGVVCAVGLFSLGNASAVARIAVSRQLALIDDAAAMSAFLYQKGFVAEYLLTGNRAWLAELESNRPAFESWLRRMHGKVGGRRTRSGCSARSSPSISPTIGRAARRSPSTMPATRPRPRPRCCSNHAQAQRAARSVRRVRPRRARRRRDDAGRRRAVRAAARRRAGGDQRGRRSREPPGRVPLGPAHHQADHRARGAGRVGGRADAHPPPARTRGAGDAGRPGERHRREAGGDRRGAVRAPSAPGAEREAVGGRRAGRQAGARGPEPAGRDEGGHAAARAPGGGRTGRRSGGRHGARARSRDHARRGAGPAAHELRPAAGAPVRALHHRQPGRRRAGGVRARRWRATRYRSRGARSPTFRRWRSTRSWLRRRWST